MLGEPPTSHCVTCVPTYIVCSIVQLGGLCEVRQEMVQQREELLREMELLKTELMGKLHVCLCVNVFMGMCGIIIVHMRTCMQGRREDTCVSAILITELWQQSLHNHCSAFTSRV